MDRIQQALERAKQEQQALKPAAATTIGRTPAPVAEPVLETQITYSKTKVQEVSQGYLQNNRIISANDTEPSATAYRMLRTQVLQKMVAKGWNALAITSPGIGNGKSLTAINLAISLARELNYTVLLVDLDMRNPSVHRYFGLTPAKGISDFLLHNAPLQEILVNPGIERLVLLPGREVIRNSSELLSSPKMSQLVADLKSRYPTRFVLFDLPPLLSADDAIAFAPHVDAALLVVEEGVTTREEVEHAVRLLSNTELLGTVLNKSATPGTDYYY